MHRLIPGIPPLLGGTRPDADRPAGIPRRARYNARPDPALGVSVFPRRPSRVSTLLIGDYILVDNNLYGAPGDTPKAWLGQRKVERGDVVVFRFPEDPDTDYVKRVIGLPGELVEVQRGRVLIDGRTLDEPYVAPEDIEPHQNFPPTRVPEGRYFMMGDNRDQSLDSRRWGFLPRSLIRGRAFLVFFSYEEERNAHLNTGWRAIASIARKIPGIPTRTRWTRIGSRID